MSQASLFNKPHFATLRYETTVTARGRLHVLLRGRCIVDYMKDEVLIYVLDRPPSEGDKRYIDEAIKSCSAPAALMKGIHVEDRSRRCWSPVEVLVEDRLRRDAEESSSSGDLREAHAGSPDASTEGVGTPEVAAASLIGEARVEVDAERLSAERLSAVPVDGADPVEAGIGHVK